MPGWLPNSFEMWQRDQRSHRSWQQPFRVLPSQARRRSPWPGCKPHRSAYCRFFSCDRPESSAAGHRFPPPWKHLRQSCAPRRRSRAFEILRVARRPTAGTPCCSSILTIRAWLPGDQSSSPCSTLMTAAPRSDAARWRRCARKTVRSRVWPQNCSKCPGAGRMLRR